MIDRYVRSKGHPTAPGEDSWVFDALLISDGGEPIHEQQAPPTGFGNDLLRLIDVIYANSTVSVTLANASGLPIQRIAPDQIGNSRELRLDNAELMRLAQLRGASVDEVRAELIECVSAFSKTPTLTDQVSATAKKLFLLGKYLVWLDLPKLQAGLKDRATH
jgi:hypothetical protein